MRKRFFQESTVSTSLDAIIGACIVVASREIGRTISFERICEQMHLDQRVLVLCHSELGRIKNTRKPVSTFSASSLQTALEENSSQDSSQDSAQDDLDFEQSQDPSQVDYDCEYYVQDPSQWTFLSSPYQGALKNTSEDVAQYHHLQHAVLEDASQFPSSQPASQAASQQYSEGSSQDEDLRSIHSEDLFHDSSQESDRSDSQDTVRPDSPELVSQNVPQDVVPIQDTAPLYAYMDDLQPTDSYLVEQVVDQASEHAVGRAVSDALDFSESQDSQRSFQCASQGDALFFASQEESQESVQSSDQRDGSRTPVQDPLPQSSQRSTTTTNYFASQSSFGSLSSLGALSSSDSESTSGSESASVYDFSATPYTSPPTSPPSTPQASNFKPLTPPPYDWETEERQSVHQLCNTLNLPEWVKLRCLDLLVQARSLELMNNALDYNANVGGMIFFASLLYGTQRPINAVAKLVRSTSANIKEVYKIFFDARDELVHERFIERFGSLDHLLQPDAVRESRGPEVTLIPLRVGERE